MVTIKGKQVVFSDVIMLFPSGHDKPRATPKHNMRAHTLQKGVGTLNYNVHMHFSYPHKARYEGEMHIPLVYVIVMQ